MDRTNQEIALNNVRNGVYIIGSIDINGNVSFSSMPAVHPTAALARQEAARLARANPGKAFVFVKMAGAELVPTATISI